MATNQEEVVIRLGVSKDGSWKLLGEAKKDIEGAGDGVEYFNTHGREMHKLLHLLDHALPGLGISLRMFFHPMGVGIAAIVLGVQGLISWMHAAREKAVEMFEKQMELAENVRKANEDSLKAQTDAAKEFEKIMNSTQQSVNDMIKQKSAERTTLLDAEIAQYKRLIDAQESREMASAKGDATEQAAIRKRYEALRNEFDTQGQIEKLKIKNQELSERKSHGKAMKGTIDTYEAAKNDLGLDEGYNAAISRLKSTNESMLKKKISDLGVPGFFEQQMANPVMGDLDLGVTRKAREKKLAAAQKELEQFQHDEKIKEIHDTALGGLNEKIQALGKEYTENGKAAAALTEEIKMTRDAARAGKKKLDGKDPLSLDTLIHEMAVSPKLQQFLDLRNAILSGNLSGVDRSVLRNQLAREFAGLSMEEKIKSVQGENLPANRNDLQRKAYENELQALLKQAVETGIKIKELPTDDHA